MNIGSSKSAYMLVYEKTRKSKIKFELKEETKTEDLKQIRSFLRNEKDLQINENIVETSFNNIKQYIPKVYEEQIQNDNINFVLS